MIYGVAVLDKNAETIHGDTLSGTMLLGNRDVLLYSLDSSDKRDNETKRDKTVFAKSYCSITFLPLLVQKE